MPKILVIDDQPDNVNILQAQLEHEKFEVISAYDGPSGIEKTHAENPDLILLDVMMPGMSGFEVCSQIVNDESTRTIPIILITALTAADDLKEGLQAGAFDYIKKPFNRVELIARVRSALRFKETSRFLIELEKINTFAATVVTANHSIKQPLTLINISTAAIKREISKENISPEAVLKKVEFIEKATKDIINVLDQMNKVKKPVFTDYFNNLKMIDLNCGEKELPAE
ncbi:MAG: response regulator [bacterium]